MHLLDLTLPTAAENLALDEALLLSAESGNSGACLRLWELPRYAVVLGRSNHAGDEVFIDACIRDGVPVLRRCSGGGAVLNGPGSLLYTLILSVDPEQHLHGIPAVTAAVLSRTVSVLRRTVPGITACGTSDLAWDGRKVSGNSQRWLRRYFLHHGTLLYGFDVPVISRYLKMPSRKPEYRGERSHAEFVTNLPLERERLRQLLIEAWQADEPHPDVPYASVEQLTREKYGSDTWNLRL